MLISSVQDHRVDARRRRDHDLALYYFFLDGPNMIAAIMRMSPLDDEYERELLEKFANVSRAVVVASLASAVAQGLLAGVGFYFALNAGAPIFLLTMITMVWPSCRSWAPPPSGFPPCCGFTCSKPPVDGAEAVQGDAVSAIGLAIYGVCVISAIDNVIKPLVLHGQSNLHPLLALLSVLGGVKVLGPIGILVGPMLVAFFQALVNMVNKELLRFGDATFRGQARRRHGAAAAGTGDRGRGGSLGRRQRGHAGPLGLRRCGGRARSHRRGPESPASAPPAKRRRRRK